MLTAASTQSPSVTDEQQLLHKHENGRWSTVSWVTSKAAVSCSISVFSFAINQALGAELGILNCFFT
uniref:Uncharacterized protein n=1 Tax=Zea mays TaxID=4577 RepID=C4J128_MAIZE|nr:unknown [Zea mays]